MSPKVPSAVFCGAQSIPSTSDTYDWIRRRLQKDPELQDLAQAVLELPALWARLIEKHAFCAASVGDPLKILSHWLDLDSPRPLTIPESLPNVLLAPLNAVAQLVQYKQYLRDQHHAGKSHAQILQSVSSSAAGVQGLCTGLLTATVLACSRDWAEVATNATVAVRLAMCIGAAVDADERERAGRGEDTHCLVAFGSPDLDRRQLMAALREYPSLRPLFSFSKAYISVELDAHRVTITAAEDDAPALTENLLKHGIKVKALRLKGRYHNPVHKEVVEALKAMCQDEPCLRFKPKSRPLVPLRCNTTGDLVQSNEILHEVCLRSILMEPADWHSTLSASIAGMTPDASQAPVLLELGFTSCMPGSLAIHSRFDVASVSPDVHDDDDDDEGLAFSYPDHSIAIVGAAGRFSGASNLDQLWDLLCAGASTVSTGEPDASNPVRGDDDQTRTASYLSNVDAFDRGLFGYSPSEAEFMDPQHRVGLQVAYEAVEGAGYLSPDSSSQKDVGCYVGIATSDYEANVACHRASAFSFTGTARSFVSGRISHHFGWTGPSIAIDTACSSSAVAITLACKDLITKECKMALAGGVSIISNARTSRNLAAAHFLSASAGPCRSFDEAADGFSRGEGCGLILLKRLDDALEDNDQVLGVITGTATNQNINHGSITVPVHQSQVDVYRRSLAASGLDPSRVSYVEAHGTGTPKGDPIEYQSIRQVFGARNKRSQPLYVGSLKANIGHAEAASGVASVLKVLLMMRHGQLPPQANFSRFNPAIHSLDSDQISISTALQPWKASFRAASINNYGASGNNTAMIVCQPPRLLQKPERQEAEEAAHYPFLLSANTKASLRRMCESIREYLASAVQQPILRLGDLAFQIGSRQNQRLRYRAIFDAGSISEVQDHLQQHIADSEAPVFPGPPSITAARPIVMIFAGQTGNSVHINKNVYDGSALLRLHLDRCDAVLRQTGWPSLFPSIFQPKTDLDVISLHCMLFAVQYSCARAWIDAGLPVQRVIGHSIGQLTALCVAGCITLEDTLSLIAGRASLIKGQWDCEAGVMLAVDLDRSNAEQLVRSIANEDAESAVEIACFNSPTRHILVGTEASIGKVETRLMGRVDNSPRRLKTTHGFHSRLADSIMKSYGNLAHSISYHEPSIPIETCSPGRSWPQVTAELVAQQTRQPVYFLDAIRRIEEELGSCTWLEAGSGSSGTSLVRHALQTPESHSFHSVQLAASDPMASLQRTTQQLWSEGVTVQYWLYHRMGGSSLCLPPRVPGYQFDESHHWLPYKEPEKEVVGDNDSLSGSSGSSTSTSLLTRIPPRAEGGEVAKFSIDTQNEEYQTWLSSRVVLGSFLCSIASYVELSARAAVLLSTPSLEKQNPCFRISDLSLCVPLGLQVDGPLTLTLRPTTVPLQWEFSIDSAIQHARGQVAAMLVPRTSAPSAALRRLIDYRYCQNILADPSSSCLRGPLTYKILDRVVQCVPSYQGIQASTIRDLESVTLVTVPPAAAEGGSTCSPQTLDQLILAAELHILSLDECSSHDVFVCSEMAELTPFSSAPLEGGGPWMVYTRLSWADERTILCDTLVFDTVSQQSIMALLGRRYTRLSASSLQKALSAANNRDHQQQEQQRIIPVPCHADRTDMPPVILTPSTSATPSGEDGVEDKLRSILSHLTGVPPARLLPTTSLAELGVDSLMTIELRRVCKEDFQVDLPQDIDGDHYTVGDLSAAAGVDHPQLCQQPFSSPPTARTPASSCVPNSLASLPHGGGVASASQTVQYRSVCEIVSRLIGIVTEHLNCPDRISPDIQLQHLGFDSLAAMDLESQLVQEFGPGKLVLHQLSPASTIEDLAHMVLSSLGQPSLHQICTPTARMSLMTAGGSTSSSPSSLLDTGFLFGTLSWFAGIRQGYGQLARMAGFEGFYTHVYPRQMRLLIQYIVDAFGALGYNLLYIPAGSPVPRVPHLPRYAKLVDLYYRILEETGIIRREEDEVNNNNNNGGGDWIRTSNAIDYTPTSETYQALYSDFPAYRPEHELLHRTGSRLADCLSGQADPLSLLFHGPKAHQLLEKVYSDCPMFNAGTRLLTHFLGQVMSPSSPGPVRILELGAGTGGTTKHVLEQLQARGLSFQYTFSDVSPTLVARARDRLGALSSPSSSIDFAVVDIEQPPAQDHIQAYDVVISANCIHATKDLGISSENICALLRPRGMLCLLELTRDVYWLDGVFGLLDGWWRFEDGREHSLVDEQRWKSILQKAGFAHVEWTDDESRESDAFRLICGLKP
ncbi:hypothetical protein BDW62DRAFT_200838 [Aspergillus aurantiobrunneus]